jgi:hypothetical protein
MNPPTIDHEIQSPVRCSRCGRPSTRAEPVDHVEDLGIMACSECAIILRKRQPETGIKTDKHGWLVGDEEL